jgi:hypothetical protein
MNEDDPLIRLLQTADSAAAAPQSPADLVGRVYQRRKAQVVRRKRIQIGALAGAAVILAVALVRLTIPRGEGRGEEAVAVANIPAERQGSTPDRHGRAMYPPAAEVVEADALEKWIAARQRSERLQELTAEHDRLLVATSAPDPAATALDRAAGNAVCQAEFLLETLGDRRAAIAAYRNVTEQFPDTHWAMIASDNLSRLEMN